MFVVYTGDEHQVLADGYQHKLDTLNRENGRLKEDREKLEFKLEQAKREAARREVENTLLEKQIKAQCDSIKQIDTKLQASYAEARIVVDKLKTERESHLKTSEAMLECRRVAKLVRSFVPCTLPSEIQVRFDQIVHPEAL